MEGSIMNTEFTENIEPHEDESIEFEYLYRMNLGLSASAIKHIRRLLSVWGMLADLSFSDLVLCIQRGSHLAIVGQVRPGTAATMIGYDLVGTEIKMSDFPLASESMMSRSIVSEVDDNFFLGNLDVQAEDEQYRARIEYVPVCMPDGNLVALLVRVGSVEEPRRAGRLERIYRDLYQRLTAMVLTGNFPFNVDIGVAEAPRVGDGLMVTDGMAKVTFASPNAINALHRFGITKSVEGLSVSELGISRDTIKRVIDDGRPSIEEVESPPDVVVIIYAFPLIEADSITGAMVLVRDITDLRRKDRLLLSKDAAIREVHHRVKNNLQTISSLLRLQARRLERGKGKEELLEAERRVRSIAAVHEILAREPGGDVPFDDIVSVIVDMARDSIALPGSVQDSNSNAGNTEANSDRIEIVTDGRLGDLPADIATPLAVVTAELLQNAIEHAFCTPGCEDGDIKRADRSGTVKLSMRRSQSRLYVSVIDDGVGLPPDFDLASTNSLGLSLVKGLVESQLLGMISMESNGGTTAEVVVPYGARSSE